MDGGSPTEPRALGIDAGSTTAKIVAVDDRGRLVWHHLEDMNPRVDDQARALLDLAVQRAGATPGLPLVATGYGRNLVSGANRKVTEITCHARGVHRALGHGGTLVDIGGQDSKVIAIAPNGKVTNFAMNDKCAAGTGRFLEVVSARLKMPIGEFAHVALQAPEEVSISSTCTVFAESEMISLIAHGDPVERIIRGLHRSLAKRIAALARSVGITPPVMLSGGVARNEAIRRLLSEELGQEVTLPERPQLMGAYGAALIALGSDFV